MSGRPASSYAWTDDWPTTSLGEIASIHSGSTPRRNVPGFWGGTIPWVTPGELTSLDAKYLTETREQITSSGLASCAASLVPKDALLVTTRATLGSAALAAMPITTNQGFRSLVFGSAATPHFFYHLNSRLVPEFTRRASGTTFLEISSKQFADVAVPLPTLHEQHRIAEILDTIDEAIRKTEQVIAKLQQIKQGLLHDLLTRGIDENGELRDPARTPEQFSDSRLGRIPKEWEVTQIAEVAEFITSGSRGWAAFYSDSGPLFLRIGNLTREHINLRFASVVHVRPPRGSEGKRTGVEEGDILVSITADLGIVGVVPPGFGEAYVNQHVALVRLDSERAHPRWIGHFLAGRSSQKQFERLNDQGAKSGLNLPGVGGLLVALPPQREQSHIARILDETDERIAREMRGTDKLRTLKRGLIDDLLTGRIRVPQLEEVSA